MIQTLWIILARPGQLTNQAAASRLRRAASRKSASDDLLGADAADGWAGDAVLTDEVLSATSVAGVDFASVPGNGAGLASSASLAFAIISSSDVTVPAGVPSRDTRAAPADNSRR